MGGGDNSRGGDDTHTVGAADAARTTHVVRDTERQHRSGGRDRQLDGRVHDKPLAARPTKPAHTAY